METQRGHVGEVSDVNNDVRLDIVDQLAQPSKAIITIVWMGMAISDYEVLADFLFLFFFGLGGTNQPVPSSR